MIRNYDRNSVWNSNDTETESVFDNFKENWDFSYDTGACTEVINYNGALYNHSESLKQDQ